jgi:sialate O-acetylesterase
MWRPISALCIALVAFPAAAEVRLASPFSDHMVLQQRTRAAIWGEAGPSEKVSVTGSWGGRASATADKDGHWLAHLPTPTAGGPFTVTANGVTLNDVLVGEVWLCSGQSNMAFPAHLDPVGPSDESQVRLFQVPGNIQTSPTTTSTPPGRSVRPRMQTIFLRQVSTSPKSCLKN